MVTVNGPIQQGVIVSARGEISSSKQNLYPYMLEETDRVALPAGHVDQVVRNLLPRANAGDARASLALYRKLDECYTAIHKSVSAEEIAIYEAIGAGANFEEKARAAQQNCTTDGTSDFSTRGRWLERAAEGGLLEAKLIYATDIDAFFPSESEMIRDPKGLEDYKRRAVRYISELATQGNVDSMMWLANSYANGTMIEYSPINSYAYYKAVDFAIPGIISQEMLFNLRARLTANEQRHGDELAISIYEQCCSR